VHEEVAKVIEHMDRFGNDGWWWWSERFLPFLLVLILIGIGVWAILRFGSRAPVASGPALASAGPADRALEEVRLRYARGEILREEFVQRTRDLGGPVADLAERSSPVPPPEGPTEVGSTKEAPPSP
jgi:putative membrane protein